MRYRNPLTGLEMIKPTGGRGKRAPYETTHLRVPIPLKSAIEAMIEGYRAEILEGSPPPKEDGPLPLSEAIEIAQKLLRGKTSKLATVEKLLTAIYKEDVNGFIGLDK
jgi:hypothetical protein